MENKYYFKILLFLITLLLFFNCSIKKKIPVISNLELEKNSMELNGNILTVFFNKEGVNENKAFTKKEFSKYNLSFTPFREANLENSLSLFLHYKDSNNFYRFNIFLDTGKIHLYKYNDARIINLLFKSLNKFNSSSLKDNIFNVNLNKSYLKIIINNEIYFSDKLNFNEGRFGIGAYGKKGDTAKFIFKNN